MDTRIRFSALVQNYFFTYLINQRRVSDKTIKSYRDTFRLLFKFIAESIGKTPAQLCIEDMNSILIAKFLDYLETSRKNTVRTRNIRFAAIRSFLKYVAFQEPATLPTIQQVLAIPFKRYDYPLIGFLSRKEINSILNAPDQSTWSGKRDHILFSALYNSGARVSEIIAVKRSDVEITHTAVINLHGKGRKERTVPLWKNTSNLIRKWLSQIDENPQTPLFPNHFGKAMTRSGVENRLKAAIKTARIKCTSLEGKKVSPHVIRHTTAMHLLQSGADLTVIALWLGHESITTTHRYLEADLQMKERIINKMKEPEYKKMRKLLPDSLISFLESL